MTSDIDEDEATTKNNAYTKIDLYKEQVIQDLFVDKGIKPVREVDMEEEIKRNETGDQITIKVPKRRSKF